MRKLLFVLIITIPLVILGILIFKNQSTTPEKSGAQNIEGTTTANKNSIEINNLTFSWFEVESDKLTLVPNFTEKLTSKEFLGKNNCKLLTNASFYSKDKQSLSADSRPIGLFISRGETLQNYQINSFFDGILSINDMATPRITREIPRDHLQNAVQIGPIIKENGSYLTLKIKDDSGARRVLAGVTGDNKLIFVVIYKADSEYLGPYLTDLPNILKDFEEKAKITFADIINLDGGAASTFNSPGVKLSELTSVGAFFCQP